MRYFGNNIELLVNNLVVSYTDQGNDDAPVIIFIHGFPLNKSIWDNQMDALKEHYRVIAYDIRGHGNSDAGNEDFSIELFVNDLMVFMNMLKIEKASLCGLSMGGYIALNAIEKYPERFTSLVLSDTTCKADSAEAKEKRTKDIRNILENGVVKYAEDSAKNLFTLNSFKVKKAEVNSVKEMISSTTEQSICCTLLALASRNETCSTLSKINVPVLLMVGEDDKITPPEALINMHVKIKDSNLQIIENAAHLSNLENPEAFNEHLKKFFAAVYIVQLNNNSGGDYSLFREIRNKLNMLLSFRSI
jgi:3-oxoadipate enol-lactonase